MQEPLVSVLIPAYNHELYVEQTIQSIIKQTYNNIELIVIDDGSRDGTWNILQNLKSKCEDRFSRVLMSTRENRGTCRTLNELIASAQGKYIALIASDDTYTPTAISSLVEVLENKPDSILAVGKNLIIDSEGRIAYWNNKQELVYTIKEAKYTDFSHFLHCAVVRQDSPEWGTYKALVRANHIPNGYLIRKSALDQLPPFTTEAPLEDYWLMLQLSKIGKFENINSPTFHYRWHSTNTAKETERMLDYTERTLHWEENFLKDQNNIARLKEFRDAHWIHKTYFRLPPFLCLCRLKKDKHKKIILKIGSKEWVLFEYDKKK